MNNTMVREIRGAKINPKLSFKIRVRKIRGGGNYASKYGIYGVTLVNRRVIRCRSTRRVKILTLRKERVTNVM
jgi:hypothetical protein